MAMVSLETSRGAEGSVVPKSTQRARILEALAERTCQVVWTIGEEDSAALSFVVTSGCFIKDFDPEKVQVLTCFHSETWSTARIQVSYNRYRFEARLNNSVSPLEAKKHDLCVIDFDPGEHAIPCFQYNSPYTWPVLGETVYFAGFPLTQDASPLVHKARVAAFQESDETDSFVIDGTVVAGHSGGPIVTATGDQLNLLGVISSQLVDISKAFMEAAQFKGPTYVSRGHMPAMIGNKTASQVVREIMEVMLANHSTGIGKATHLINLAYMKKGDGEPEQAAGCPEASCSGDVKELSVMKKRVLEREMKDNGWHLERQGAGHEIWANGKGVTQSVPRHTTIAGGTAQRILTIVRENPGKSNP